MQNILHMHKFYTLCCLSTHFAIQKTGDKSSKRDHVNPLDVEEEATSPPALGQRKARIYIQNLDLSVDLIVR